ncbi:MAG: hypothetical protein COA69_11755 [Robiginitomaculum sp.]|nr:MAG: hypothetical protein COA69_11755 [Robiginitomaculum sp.]
MVISALPDLLAFQRQVRLTGDLKAQLARASHEAVTGRYDDITAAVNGAVGETLLLQKALDDIDQDTRINALSSARLSLISTSVHSVRDAVDGLAAQGLVALTTGDSFSLDTVAVQAEANLRSAMAVLNTSHGNRRLFAGDATDKLPLATTDILLADLGAILTGSPTPAAVAIALDTYFNDPAGGFATNIYQGGSADAAPAYLADGSRIQFGVRADNQAIRDTLRGLSIMALAGQSGHSITSSSFKDIFKQGTNLVETGNNALIKLEASIGVFQGLVEDSTARQSEERLTINIALNSMIERDQYDAAAELKRLETQVESSYLITARLASLHLSNFLR